MHVAAGCRRKGRILTAAQHAGLDLGAGAGASYRVLARKYRPASFDDLIGAVENGISMETNVSWSIDDSRNKFQFGCERARLIKNGKLGAVVKNPNHRGISATFWRNLKGLGNTATVQVLGTPTCGKGEPNQAIRVGHASPPGLFADVQIFGGG